MKRNHVWILEYYKDRKWVPSSGHFSRKKDAVIEVDIMRDHSDYTYRVVKYVAEVEK